MAADDTEVLSFTVDIGGKRAMSQMAAINKGFKVHMAAMTKETRKANAVTEKLMFASQKFGTDYAKSLKLSYKQVDALNSSWDFWAAAQLPVAELRDEMGIPDLAPQYAASGPEITVAENITADPLS